MNRRTRIAINVTPEEYDRIMEAVKLTNKSMTQFMHAAALKTADLTIIESLTK